MTDLKTVVIGDKAIEVALSDAHELKAHLASLEAAQAQRDAGHKAELDARDAELAKRDAEIEALKKAQLDADAVSRLVADRVALETNGRKLADSVDPAGLTDADYKRAVVAELRGADAVDGKSEAYVDAAFDFAVDTADATDADPVRKAIASRDGTTTDAAGARDKAYADYVASLNSGTYNTKEA